MSNINQLKSIHRYGTVISIAVILSLVTGILPSFILSDWLWFSRSGSLLAIFGIYLIWQDYHGQINNDLDKVLDGFSDHLKKTIKNESNREQMKEEVSNQFNKVRVANKKRFQNIEFCLVTLGTLIWAYGDLINKYY
jgi:ABC-type nickel/cobalt efflux system permease component RcnA